jgi:hypothetical protein
VENLHSPDQDIVEEILRIFREPRGMFKGRESKDKDKSSLVLNFVGLLQQLKSTFQIFSVLDLPHSHKTKLGVDFMNFETSPDMDILIRKSLNGFILIDKQNELVAKALKWEFEPNFLDNEVMARCIYPGVTQQILRSFRFNDYDILVTNYNSKSRGYDQPTWHKIFPQIILKLFKNYDLTKDNILEERSGEMEVEENNLISFPEFYDYDLLYAQNENLIAELLLLENFYGMGSAFFPKVLAHGDLMPSNLLIQKNGQPVLIDWVNGGLHNMFYDLAIQEIYAPQSLAWTRFFQWGLRDLEKSRLYSNGIKVYKEMYVKFTGRDFEINALNFGIILSIKDFSYKNYLRHRNIENYSEGLLIQALIATLLNNIRDSRVKSK